MSDLVPEMSDSVIAEKMLKLFDGGRHWISGSYWRDAGDEAGSIAEGWCLVGAYLHVTAPGGWREKDEGSRESYRNSPFLKNLALMAIRNNLIDYAIDDGFTEWDEIVIEVNDSDECLYDVIRVLLEEMRNSEQAEHGNGIA